MSYDDNENGGDIREIHALTSPSTTRHPPTRSTSSTLSIGSVDSENFTSMSREFNALVVAGASIDQTSDTSPAQQQQQTVDMQLGSAGTTTMSNNLSRIREDHELLEEHNPLAIVPDSNPIPSPTRASTGTTSIGAGGYEERSSLSAGAGTGLGFGDVTSTVHAVKKEETESKIAAWQTAEIAKINNRFKREDVIINGWESDKVEKATAWLKKVERKLEEQRARAMEKMENEVAKARRKAEEKRASAEAKRGMKVAKVMEVGNLLRAVGRAPSKRSFFF